MNKKSPGNSGFLSEQAEEIRARGGYFVSPGAQEKTAADDVAGKARGQRATNMSSQDFLDESSRFIAADEELVLELPAYDDSLDRLPYAQAGSIAALDDPGPAAVPEPAPATEPVPAPEPAANREPGRETKTALETTQRRINLPMGAWLGFHDGDTPLMARLAVYDLENDYYIFVNRKGVKMRQVSRLELLDLIDNELVDILETNSNFRDEVTEVRKKLDQ
jgi:hypothetical protein